MTMNEKCAKCGGRRAMHGDPAVDHAFRAEPEHLFSVFEEAREWAAKNVKGHPAWRVVTYRAAPDQFAIELNPTQPGIFA